ncbi:F-box protein, partial [Thalictrum thalictroides]
MESDRYNKRQKGCCSKRDEDRISNLQDEILLHIFSFLSMNDVVRSSVLSRRWEHLWTNVQTLCFYGPTSFDRNALEKFVSFVNRTLFLLVSNNIHSFKLEGCVFNSKYKSEEAAKRTEEFCLLVDKWIQLLVQKKVRCLQLRFSFSGGYRYKVPCDLLINNTINDLYLGRCSIDAVRPIQWKCLKKLKLKRVELNDDLMQNILNGSPLLKDLHLALCHSINSLSITSSKLKKLRLYLGDDYSVLKLSAPYVQILSCGGDITKYHLVDVSSVVYFHGYSHSRRTIDDSYQPVVERILEKVRYAKECSISFQCIQ